MIEFLTVMNIHNLMLEHISESHATENKNVYLSKIISTIPTYATVLVFEWYIGTLKHGTCLHYNLTRDLTTTCHRPNLTWYMALLQLGT